MIGPQHKNDTASDARIELRAGYRRRELVCAVIEAAPDSPELQFDAMVTYLLGTGLTLQKIPERLEALNPLPRNAFSKVSKAELRQRFGA